MQIIRRKRLGNNTEDIDSPQILLKSTSIVIMDGYDVLGVPPLPVEPPAIVEPTRVGGPQAVQAAVSPIPRPTPLPTAIKLFDVLSLPVKAAPRGISTLGSKGLFVFNDPTQPDKLFLSDGRGAYLGSIDIQYRRGEAPQFIEGISQIPNLSSLYPDHLVMIASFPDPNTGIQSRLEIINPNGQVELEIVPQGGIAATALTGVCFKSPNSFLVSSDDNETIYELDIKGNITNSFNTDLKQHILHGIEGLAQTSDGRITAASGFDGFLVSFDWNTILQPQVIDYRIGPGLSLPTGLAWDSSRDQFLINAFDRERSDEKFISALEPSFTAFKPVVPTDGPTQRLAYLPDERLIAATHLANPRAILLFNEQGQAASQIITDQFGSPRAIGYIPTTREFVLGFRDPQNVANPDKSKPRKLFVLKRDGTLSRIIDLTGKGARSISAVTFFNPQHPSGGQFLAIDAPSNTAIVIDFDGNVLDKFGIKDKLQLLSPTDVTAITTGPFAGALAITNGETSEVVVFRLG